MSKLSQLDSSLHDYFLQNDNFRDLSEVSKALQMLGKWLHEKRKNTIVTEGNFLWYWKN